MYTFREVEELGFKGDIVLDMFNGSGSTTLSAYISKRRFIGIELNIDYCNIARDRIANINRDMARNLIIDKIKMPNKNNTNNIVKATEEKMLFEL